MVVDGFCVEEQQDSAINGLIEELSLTAQIVEGFCSTGKQRTACVNLLMTRTCIENSCDFVSVAIVHSGSHCHANDNTCMFCLGRFGYLQTFTIFKTFYIQLRSF